MNPQHELTVAKPFQQWRNLTNYCQKTNMPLITEMIQKCSPCTTESIILKPFCSFYDDIEKLRFLKNYCLLNKALRNRFKVPTTFNYYDYVTSATFDDIFQSSKYKKSQREESSTPKGIIPINLWLRDIILCLACDAENIQYKTPKKQ